MEIVKINHEDYGLEQSKAKEIEAAFKPMLEKMTGLEDEFNEVAKLANNGINDEVVQKARELRLKYVKVRTGTAEIHKEMKAFYLAGGRFVDGWKNAQVFASQGIEEKLKSIEDHFENLEKEKKLKLQEERAEKLRKFEVDPIPETLGIMDEDMWNNYISGVETNYKARKEAEAKAEADRIEKEKKENLFKQRREQLIPFGFFIDLNKLTIDSTEDEFNKMLSEAKEFKKKDDEEKEKQRKENERLKKQAEEREKKAEAERKKREAEEKKRQEEERKRKEAEEKERQRLQAEAEAKLKAEREAKEKAEAELKAKNEAEAKAEADRKAAIEAEKMKDDEEKVNDLLVDLESIKNKYQFESESNQEMHEWISDQIDSIIAYVKE